MPIGVQQFQPEQPGISPLSLGLQALLQGIAAGQGIKSNYYKNKYLAPTLQAQLQEQQLKNQYIPQDKAVELQRALNAQGELQQSMNRFGPATALRQTLNAMSKSGRAAWIAQNNDAYNALLESEKNTSLNSQGIAPNVLGDFISPQLQQQMQNQVARQQRQPSPVMAPQNEVVLADALKQMQQQTDARITGSQEPLSVDVVARPVDAQTEIIRRAEEDSANFEGLSNFEKKRYGAAKTMDNFFKQPQVLESLYQSTKYPGLLGKAEKFSDYFSNPEEFNAYKVATDKLPSIFSGSLSSLEGYPTSELGLTSAKDFLKFDGLAPGSSRKDYDKVVDAQLDLIDQENKSITGEYERYFNHQDELVSNKVIMQQYRKLRNDGLSPEEAYPKAIESAMNPKTEKFSLKTQLENKAKGEESESKKEGWFKDSNGKLKYRASDGSIHNEEDIK